MEQVAYIAVYFPPGRRDIQAAILEAITEVAKDFPEVDYDLEPTIVEVED
jgi:hypothetical protein